MTATSPTALGPDGAAPGTPRRGFAARVRARGGPMVAAIGARRASAPARARWLAGPGARSGTAPGRPVGAWLPARLVFLALPSWGAVAARPASFLARLAFAWRGGAARVASHTHTTHSFARTRVERPGGRTPAYFRGRVERVFGVGAPTPPARFEAHGRWTPVARVLASHAPSGVAASARASEPGAVAPATPVRTARPDKATADAPLPDWEVRRLADRVLDAMDRRLIAYRERRGRA